MEEITIGSTIVFLNQSSTVCKNIFDLIFRGVTDVLMRSNINMKRVNDTA